MTEYQYEAILMGGKGLSFNDKHVITDEVAQLYDLVTASMDWGSGMLDEDEMRTVVKLGVLCGFDIPKCGRVMPYQEGEWEAEIKDKTARISRGSCGLDMFHAEKHQAERTKWTLLETTHVPQFSAFHNETFNVPVNKWSEPEKTQEEWED